MSENKPKTTFSVIHESTNHKPVKSAPKQDIVSLFPVLKDHPVPRTHFLGTGTKPSIEKTKTTKITSTEG